MFPVSASCFLFPVSVSSFQFPVSASSRAAARSKVGSSNLDASHSECTCMQFEQLQASYTSAITASSAPLPASRTHSGALTKATEICQIYGHRYSSAHDRPCAEIPSTGGYQVHAAACAFPSYGSLQEARRDGLNAPISMYLLDSGDSMVLDATNNTGASV